MTKYIDLESIKEIRKMLGLDSLIISKGTLSYILDSIKDLYNNLDLNESYASKASYFLYRITKDHPFSDGNKRTAFAVADTFLRINGYYIDIESHTSVEFIVKVAECKKEESEVKEWIKNHMKHKV